ncbi:MAG: NADH-ubiquinone oxidoreductase-F iron-sulfur binding region domain-containing protein, partial [Candidatus Limnocylindrales bacterium]
QPALNYVCKRLTVPPAEAWGVVTFYALFATSARPPTVAHVCDDLACRLAGSDELCADLERTMAPEGAPFDDGRTMWLRSPCLGMCERAPAMMLTEAGELPQAFAAGPVDAVGIAARLRAERSVWGPEFDPRPIPQVGQPGLRLLARIGVVDPTSLDDYRANGGFRALERARAIGPQQVIDEVTAANLVGRGGAAFPTGRKWAAVAAQPVLPHYLVCNADESEPGTFKDRVLMEGDPFAVIESMAIEAFAVGATKAYLYVRGEYPLAEARIRTAIAATRDAGLLGDLDIELRRGAGAYICGEETALFESIEGKRGEPRNKPPFPVEVGLFGKPTAVNNVETLVNVLQIVGSDGGAAAFRAIGTDGSTGPKLFCVSGNVANPGVYEVEFGVTLGGLLALAGGVPGGKALKAVLLGGAAGVFVGPEALDTPLTFEATRAIGATLGSGVVLVFDETADMVGALTRIARFFRDESCGQCVPCRVGTVRQEELLTRLASGAAAAHGRRDDELALLRELGQVMRDASICGLGQTASSAIESALRRPELVAL